LSNIYFFFPISKFTVHRCTARYRDGVIKRNKGSLQARDGDVRRAKGTLQAGDGDVRRNKGSLQAGGCRRKEEQRYPASLGV
jgi:hypothetical protein